MAEGKISYFVLFLLQQDFRIISIFNFTLAKEIFLLAANET